MAEQKLARKGYEAAATEFSEADTDASGRIDKEELRVALIRVGMCLATPRCYSCQRY